MKLMTKGIESKLKKCPLGSQDGKGKNAKIQVKYFTPWGMCTWLITEGNKEPNGDWLFFGYCYINTWEWGYVRLSELMGVRGPLGLGVERDLYLEPNITVGELVRKYCPHTLRGEL